MSLDSSAIGEVYCHIGFSPLIRGMFAFYEMQDCLAGFLSIGDLPSPIANSQCTDVTNLSTHFTVKRCAIHHDSGAVLFPDDFKDDGVDC